MICFELKFTFLSREKKPDRNVSFPLCDISIPTLLTWAFVGFHLTNTAPDEIYTNQTTTVTQYINKSTFWK